MASSWFSILHFFLLSSDIFRVWNYFFFYILPLLTESCLLSNTLRHCPCHIPYSFYYTTLHFTLFLLFVFSLFPSLFFHIFFSRSLAPNFSFTGQFLIFFLYTSNMFSFCIQNSLFLSYLPFLIYEASFTSIFFLNINFVSDSPLAMSHSLLLCMARFTLLLLQMFLLISLPFLSFHFPFLSFPFSTWCYDLPWIRTVRS